MRNQKYAIIIVIIAIFSSCGSIKSTIKNIDNNAIKPTVVNNSFVLTEYATDNKYGYDADYPINLGFENEKYSAKNIVYFFNAIQGPNGEKITYEKTETCCPFPSKKSSVGAGTLDIYQISFEGTEKKVTLYINLFEKGKVICPKGFTIKKL
jgi:hypothetical protein